jgi:hypothetical protein
MILASWEQKPLLRLCFYSLSLDISAACVDSCDGVFGDAAHGFAIRIILIVTPWPSPAYTGVWNTLNSSPHVQLLRVRSMGDRQNNHVLEN